MNDVILLMGGNMGDTIGTLHNARTLIANEIGTITAASAIYRTAAWGKTNQNDFYNQAIAVTTLLSAQQVIKGILNIEKKLGRVRDIKWAERIIDIDIIFYNEAVIHEPFLQIPHPYMQERNFVLVPLLELIPNYIHPILQLSVRELSQISKDHLQVIKVN